MVRKITNNYEKQCAKPRHVVLIGSGGAMMDDIQSVTLRFLSFDAMNVNETRTLYIELMENYLCRINRHERIRPHLHNFPFTIDNIELSIGFENSDYQITHDGHIALVFIGNNHTVYYDAYNFETKEFYTLHEETYEEALEIVKNQEPCHQ